jgi:hypothetical protein
LEELQDLFEFLEDIIPEDDGELIDPEPKRRGKKRFVFSTSSPLLGFSHKSSGGQRAS